MDIWIDGQWYPKDEARVSVFDHGLLYGDGIFEGIRVYRGRPFLLTEHLARLVDSARALLLTIPHSADELGAIIREGIARNGIAEGYIRLLVTRGVGDLGVNPFTCPQPTVVIIPGHIAVYPPEHYARGIPLIVSSLRRIGPGSLDVRIKSLNYLNNVLAKIEAVQAGCLEAVLLNHEGHVAECTADNIFVVKAGEILTPATTEGALAGITRGLVLELARQLSIPCRETRLGTWDLHTADEIFLTGTGAELMPVSGVDGRPTTAKGPGPVFRQISTAFQDYLATVV